MHQARVDKCTRKLTRTSTWLVIWMLIFLNFLLEDGGCVELAKAGLSARVPLMFWFVPR